MKWLILVFLASCLICYLAITHSIGINGGVMIPIWFKQTPMGICMVWLDIVTRHEWCQPIVYGEDLNVTVSFYMAVGLGATLLVWAIIKLIRRGLK